MSALVPGAPSSMFRLPTHPPATEAEATANETACIAAMNACRIAHNIDGIAALVPEIEAHFQGSLVLNFYAAEYYQNQRNDPVRAEELYRRCITISPDFAPPYIALATMVAGRGDFKQFGETAELLMTIFNRPLLDLTQTTPQLRIDFWENYKIFIFCALYFIQENDLQRALDMCNVLNQYFADPQLVQKMQEEPRYVVAWKSVQYHLSQICCFFDMETAYRVACQGMYRGSEFVYDPDVLAMQHKLVESIPIIAQYVMRPYPWGHHIREMAVLIGKHRLETSPPLVTAATGAEIKTMNAEAPRKIRIGYISSDLNRNAVTLFASCLFTHRNRAEFEVYVFYSFPARDFMTDYLNSFTDVWCDISRLTDPEVAQLVQKSKLDVLVDFNALAYNGRLAMLGAASRDNGLLNSVDVPVRINYIGFPDYARTTTYTHRITDHWCDTPLVDALDTPDREKSIFLPRTFLCYQPFPQFPIPPIRITSGPEYVTIGIMNKLSKHHPIVRNIWKQLHKKYPFVKLIIKMNLMEKRTHLYADLEADRVEYAHFTEDVVTYWELFNGMDISPDTIPYSGTATTCSSLMMGLPVFTVYDEMNRHVANVSGGLQKSFAHHTRTKLGLERYCTRTIQEYADALDAEVARIWAAKQKNYQAYVIQESSNRATMRSAFLKFMDPAKFMTEYEDAIRTAVRESVPVRG